MKIKICIILGTRPEIIKMSPIIRECKKRKLNFFILHTNQHYSENLDEIFFFELGLPRPKYNLNVGSETHAQGLAKMLIGIEKVFENEKPDIVLLEGDTNTVLAGALVADKLHIKVAHLEAGLRSYFKEMPEETNRILTDHCSDMLFAPTHSAKKNLLNEGISKHKIFVSGNTIVDAVFQNLKIAKAESKILKKMRIDKNNYFLLTLHRQENVDKKERLKSILSGVDLVSKNFGLPIIFPIHPRTKNKIKEFNLKISDNIKLIEPIGYLDFLQLENDAKLILTDSGGVQEEACILKTPCVTLRDNTERPETLKVGSNILAGVNGRQILNSAIKMIEKERDWINPFGNGESAEKIINLILQ